MLLLRPKINQLVLTPVVSKVASGATETVPFIQVTNWRVHGTIKIIGHLALRCSRRSVAITLSNRLIGPCCDCAWCRGCRYGRLTREHCDVLVNIPMLGFVSSLNVSVARAFYLVNEGWRQRQNKKL